MAFNESQYINMINDFFNKFSDRALLLEGEWGSGKTYFIKNSFRHSLASEDVFVYISLYGMSNIDDINRYYIDCILKEIYIKRLKTNKGINISMKMFEVIKNSNKVLDVFLDKQDIKDLIQKDNKYYIILDDLERCSIELSVILGFINNLTEQESHNVIVIANENEIGKSTTKSDLEQKYIVSLLAKSIEIAEPSLFNKDNKFTDIKDVKQLSLKTDAIFNNDTNYIYKNFKEKTFAKTITFYSDIDIIYDEKIEKLDKIELKSFLSENKNKIVSEFNNRNISNIRVLETCLKTFERFYFVISNFKTNDKYSQFKDIFIKSVILSEINHSKGFDKQKWGSLGEYSEISESSEIFSSFTAFKFLEDYIWNSYVDEQKTIKIFESFITSLNKEFVDDPINKIKYFWQMEDNVVEENIKDILIKLDNSKYPPSLFEEIFARLILLKEIGFDINLEYVLELMSKTTSDDSIPLDKMSLYHIKYNEEPYINYKSSFDKIVYIKEKLLNSQYIDILDDIFKDEFWSYQLYRIYTKYEKHFYESKQFLNFLDSNQIIENLRSSSNAVFVEFISSINSIYKSNFLEYDKDILVKIYEFLENENFKSKLKENNRLEALKIFERILKLFK